MVSANSKRLHCIVRIAKYMTGFDVDSHLDLDKIS